MGTRPNENWEARTIDSRSPKFRIDVANPEMGAEGADVYKIYAVTDNKDVNLCSLSEGGKYKMVVLCSEAYEDQSKLKS